MGKGVIVFLVLVLVLMPFVLAQEDNIFQKLSKITGYAGDGGVNTPNYIGPNAEEQQCMRDCVSVGCELNDQVCKMNNSERCLNECGLEGEPEPENEGEACMQECVKIGCELGNFECQEGNRESCEEECDMKGDAPDESIMNEEQKCITDCVGEENPGIICQKSAEGESGGRICKKCAKECEHLYAGPCINDKEIREKEKGCKTCNNCYGKIIMGDSGEGWECIVNVECADSSSEFGNESGEGPGIGQEGFVEKIGDSVGNFFKNLFGGNQKDMPDVEVDNGVSGGEETTGSETSNNPSE